MEEKRLAKLSDLAEKSRKYPSIWSRTIKTEEDKRRFELILKAKLEKIERGEY